MKYCLGLVSFLISMNALAFPSAEYAGKIVGSNDQSDGSPCSIKLSEGMASGKLTHYALVGFNGFTLAEAIRGDCTVMTSNKYPDGHYAGTVRIKIEYAKNCFTPQYFQLVSGMKQGQDVGYACAGLSKVSP